MKNFLMDLEFLRKLDLERNKTTYAKIILLTKDELPVYEIQGKITGGSINIDGASAVRRTCSLTMVSPDVDITNTYWALKNKFKLEVGVENTIDPQYPDIVWFKQGIYIFTSLNMNVQSNNFTISVNGKDKGCLINGEFGGSINASTDFGKLEEYRTLDNGEIVRDIIEIPIVDIIRNAVHVYAGEPLHNIIINDVDEYGLELLEYRGDEAHPLYLPRDTMTGEVSNMVINGEQKYYKSNDNYDDSNTIAIKNVFPYYDRTELVNDTAMKVYNDQGKEFNIIKIEFGDTAGYRRTALTYPGELVANVGEALTSVLDKIKNMFSDFEYFYDIDGRFVFQKKKTYVNTTWNNIKQSEEDIYAEDAAYTSSIAYTFEDGILLTAFTDAPAINNIKNDFSIWGKRTSASGAEAPVHMRYAINFKPVYYKNFDGTEFNDQDYDWRELIYQMALDYFKYNHTIDNFTQILAENNSKYYPTGITGYENYYTDMQGFWRQLYHPGIDDETMISETEKKELARSYLINEKKKLPNEITDKDIKNVTILQIQNELKKEYDSNYWHKNVTKAPETLNFWFDFMNTDGEMGKYAVSAIGSRPKAVNNDKVKAIYFEQTPTVLFIGPNEEYNAIDHQGYTFIRLTPQMENYFSISAQGLSAQDELNNLLYNHIYATEAVNLTAVPIYYLQPNVRIFVKDTNTGINGEFIVSKVTVPLQYNGTTSITTTRAVERIY